MGKTNEKNCKNTVVTPMPFPQTKKQNYFYFYFPHLDSTRYLWYNIGARWLFGVRKPRKAEWCYQSADSNSFGGKEVEER